MAYEKANNHTIVKRELKQALQISPNCSEANKFERFSPNRKGYLTD
jgi:hypothetical protein